MLALHACRACCSERQIRVQLGAYDDPLGQHPSDLGDDPSMRPGGLLVRPAGHERQCLALRNSDLDAKFRGSPQAGYLRIVTWLWNRRETETGDDSSGYR